MENKEIIIKDALLQSHYPNKKKTQGKWKNAFVQYILMEKMEQDFLKKFLIKILL